MVRVIAFAVALASMVAACTSEPEQQASPSATSSRSAVEVVVANYEIVAETSNRFIAGLITQDGRTVAYGTVQMRFAQDTGGSLEPTDPVVAEYLPVPGTDPGPNDEDPQAITPVRARGVYVVHGVRFLEAGQYVVEVAARIQGVGIVQGSTRFDVLAEPGVPGVGERAPRTQNPVMGEPGVPPVAIDSRSADGTIPDTSLHRSTIAGAIASGRPALVVFSTPVFCVSRFCGPVTDVVQDLARTYRREAEFIHVEVWRDFQDNTVNEAAADWLLQGATLNEPWAFLIGADGTITARWDSLFTKEELRSELDELS
jgi:hypothetical protein